ncbi:Uncharacterised protein [Mycobacteroides abscessus subsp. massiliense]|nr:Uncharacterised protein [Mycobacteroides abscessus subsp. massiliense]
MARHIPLDMSHPSQFRGLTAANARRRIAAVANAQIALAALEGYRYPKPATRAAVAVLRLRVERADLPIAQLAKLHEPPLSKDSYGARLRRAIEMGLKARARVGAVDSSAVRCS